MKNKTSSNILPFIELANISKEILLDMRNHKKID